MKFQIVNHAFHVASAIWLLQRASAQDVSDAPTMTPEFNATLNATDMTATDMNATGFETASCSAYGACAGLVDNCCPTMDGVFLCKLALLWPL